MGRCHARDMPVKNTTKQKRQSKMKHYHIILFPKDTTIFSGLLQKERISGMGGYSLKMLAGSL
jgi:hypothetical protein